MRSTLTILLGALILAANVQAFCFYNTGTEAIWVIGDGRVYTLPDPGTDGIDMGVHINGASFFQLIQPGAKSCWYWGGQSSPCAVLGFYIPNPLVARAGSVDKAFDSQLAAHFRALSGDAILIDQYHGYTRYPSSVCTSQGISEPDW